MLCVSKKESVTNWPNWPNFRRLFHKLCGVNTLQTIDASDNRYRIELYCMVAMNTQSVFINIYWLQINVCSEDNGNDHL